MNFTKVAPAGLAFFLLAGCGQGETTPGQPTAEERRALDNHAAKHDAELQQQTFDTSPDSLVPANEAAIEGNGATANAAAGEAAPAAGNAAAPR